MEYSLVLDISSGLVSLGVVANSKEQVLVHAVRKKFSTDKVHEDKAMLEALRRGLSELFEESKAEVRGVRYALLSLSSPWIVPPIAKSSLLEESEVLSSSVDKELLARLETEVTKVFGVKSHIRFKSFLPLYFEIRESKFPESKLLVAVRSGRAESDAMLVSGGKVRRVEKLGFGTDSLLGAVSESAGLPPELAESMLYLYQSNMLEESVHSYIEGVLKSYEDKEKAVFSRIAKDAEVMSITDDPLLLLTEYSSRLNWNKI